MPSFDEFTTVIRMLLSERNEPYFGLGELLTMLDLTDFDSSTSQMVLAGLYARLIQKNQDERWARDSSALPDVKVIDNERS